ncbi:hypothetical protein Tco_0861060 [Tanacetum coccineum]|uniref:Reverse transcriptase domain-containing protein n=1 Tax=Tanacetum coccineum TaxID=301880 RepID=A0ABQ5BHJ8_9ASTR
MADDHPMWGTNRAVAPTSGDAIIAVHLGDNFIVKGHHLSMIKDRLFNSCAWPDPHKHIAEFIEICGMFRYSNTNVDSIKLKLFPLSLSGDVKVWYNELILSIITTWEQMREAFDAKTKPQKKTISFAKGSDHSKLMDKIEALALKIDSQLNDIKGEMEEMQEGCRKYRGPHPLLECDDKPMEGPEEEVNYAYGGYRGGGYHGNYYVKNTSNL